MYTERCKPLEKRIWLASPTMHGDELKYINEAYHTNWMSTVGENINAIERIAAQKCEVNSAVALSSCTAALHLCVKLAGERLYGKPPVGQGSLQGKRVFCSDMTFAATLNPVLYEGGIPVFIDSERDTWNMDPLALDRAFECYPDVRLVVFAHLYGVPAKIDGLRAICDRHDALIIEDAAESMGATYKGHQTGCFGDYAAISYNGNKIITGSSGGCLLTDNAEDAKRARKWATQSRDNAPWYQHTEVGYNYRMSNVVAGVVRGQYPHLEEHIAQKKAIWERYREGFKEIPVTMNPFDAKDSEPNYWLSCMLIDESAMCRQIRTDDEATYNPEHGKSCPTEILQALSELQAEGRPIWKPMHMQPMFAEHPFITASAHAPGISEDIFARGLCLPSDNKMTKDEQQRIIETICSCFD